MTADLLAAVEAAAGLAVYGAPATAPRRGQVPAVPGTVAPGTPDNRRRAKDDLVSCRELLPQIAELHEEIGDLNHVVLVGPGHAARAITRTLGRPLTVLDHPDPSQVLALTSDPELLRRTVTVLAAGSDDIRAILLRTYRNMGLTEAEADRHFVSDALLEANGLEAVIAVALAGVDVAELLEQAELFAAEPHPAHSLGFALAGADDVALIPDGSGFEGLGGWIAELLRDAGLRPVVIEDPASPGTSGYGILSISYGGSLPPGTPPGAGIAPDVAVNGPLGAQMYAWRRAAEIASGLRGALPQPVPTSAPSVEIFATDDSGELASVLRDFAADVHDHLSVVVLTDPDTDAALAQLRPLLAAATGHPVTLDRNPDHTGDLRFGALLQITGADAEDVAVPERAYTLGGLRATRAAAARHTVSRHGRPLLRLHLTDRVAGAQRLVRAAQMLRA